MCQLGQTESFRLSLFEVVDESILSHFHLLMGRWRSPDVSVQLKGFCESKCLYERASGKTAILRDFAFTRKLFSSLMSLKLQLIKSHKANNHSLIYRNTVQDVNSSLAAVCLDWPPMFAVCISELHRDAVLRSKNLKAVILQPPGGTEPHIAPQREGERQHSGILSTFLLKDFLYPSLYLK